MTSTTTSQPADARGTVGDGGYLLEIEGIRKEFPGVVALDNVRFSLKRGTVHALMGENGAGKSTLMKIIAGIYHPDAGTLRLRGQEIKLASPLDALENGIAMIHQELNLMPFMTVAENIWIRREPKNRFGFVDHAELRRKTQLLFDALNIPIDPQIEVRDLSVANRQMVEIAKAVSYESDVLIMDEPTSALTEKEVSHLFEIIRDLRAQGKGIVYITHKMNELFEISDEFSVFRDGKYVGTHAATDVTRDDIIRMMVGREITQMFPKEDVPIGEVVLKVENLCLEGVFHDISFELRARRDPGHGRPGRLGAQQRRRDHLRRDAGHVRPDRDPRRAGGGELAAHRHGARDGVPHRGPQGDRVLPDPGHPREHADGAAEPVATSRPGSSTRARSAAKCEEMKEALRVKTPDLHERIMNLSGGNQQKVLIGRWLLTKPSILILDEPTRGIDVGAKAEIHRLITRLAGDGVAVLMISSELPEVLGMSDRDPGHARGPRLGFPRPVRG